MNCSSHRDVIVLSEIDWDYLMQRHQIFAHKYAEAGMNVVYVNRPGMRKLRISDVPAIAGRLWKIITEPSRRLVEESSIKVVTPLLLPGGGWISRVVNRCVLIPYFVKKHLSFSAPIIHLYQPTGITLEILKKFNKKFTIYDCVQNFEFHPAASEDTARIESWLIQNVDMMIVDSDYLYEKHLPERKDLVKVPPGVDFEHFQKSMRTTEGQDVKKFVYYGHIRDDLDFGLINELADRSEYKVELIGTLADGCDSKISKSVIVSDKVPYADLPLLLKSADVLLLPYKVNEFTKGIVPAKFVECLASGKPILATNLPSLEPYRALLMEPRVFFNGKPDLLGFNSKPQLLLAKQWSWDSRFSCILNGIKKDAG